MSHHNNVLSDGFIKNHHYLLSQQGNQMVFNKLYETTDVRNEKMELEKKLNEIREFLKSSIRNSNGFCYDEIETSCIDPVLEQKIVKLEKLIENQLEEIKRNKDGRPKLVLKLKF